MCRIKKRKVLKASTIFIAVVLFSVLNFQVLAQGDSSPVRQQREELLRKALKSWDTSEDATSDKYIAAFRDLNDDGKEEAIVYVIGPDWCGTGGCVTLVLVESGPSWKVISNTATTQLPIRILNGKSRGWHSIGVWAEGGGIYPGYEVELKFNGKNYPSGPSVPPASRIKGVAGEVLIPADEKAAKPLY